MDKNESFIYLNEYKYILYKEWKWTFLQNMYDFPIMFSKGTQIKEFISYDYMYVNFKKLSYGVWGCIFRW